MIPTKEVHVAGIGTFVVPADTPEHTEDGAKCITSVCGWRAPELALQEGAWGDRCGQEYSYLGRTSTEHVETVLDIGHNVGAYTVWSCRFWWPDTVKRVFAYDPNPGCKEIFKKNLSLVQRGIKVEAYTVAVTADPSPTFNEDVRWGCSWTGAEPPERVRAKPGTSVKAVHPRELPAADAIKIDAEGAERDFLDHYPYLETVKVFQIEWHTDADRILMHETCRRVGLVLRKDDCGESSQGVACWVRP